MPVVDIIHWKSRIFMMPILSSLSMPYTVIMTTYGANSDDNFGTRTNLCFQCLPPNSVNKADTISHKIWTRFASFCFCSSSCWRHVIFRVCFTLAALIVSYWTSSVTVDNMSKTTYVKWQVKRVTVFFYHIRMVWYIILNWGLYWVKKHVTQRYVIIRYIYVTTMRNINPVSWWKLCLYRHKKCNISLDD